MRNLAFIKKVHLFFIAILLSSGPAFSQNQESSCKVLLESISGEYQGDCKNGLAHGKGIAKGMDVYQGRFKKGLPHGNGEYIWQNGSYYEGSWKKGKKHGKGLLYNNQTNKEQRGIWKDDKFYKEIEVRPYQVTSKIGISGVSFYSDETTTPYKIEVVFQRDGKQSYSVSNLMLGASNGFTKESINYTGFENVNFPFEGSVKFEAPNRYNTASISSELKFIIKKPSSWKIVIRY